jgi:hypothetical protein
MSWFSRKTKPVHQHKWLDVSKTNVKLTISRLTHRWQDDDFDTDEMQYQVIPDVPHICILQKCEHCGDVRTLNLEGAIP